MVRVIDDMAEVHRLQKDTRGWHDDMALVSVVPLVYVARYLYVYTVSRTAWSSTYV